jgi:hypothetical protein
VPVLQNPWKSRDDKSGTANQENFSSKVLGQNASPDSAVASRNQPPNQRSFGRKYRMGNRRSLGG